MQRVDLYLRRAREARETAKAARTKLARVQFEMFADVWEQMAQERLALLQLKESAIAAPGLAEKPPLADGGGEAHSP
jgi:hypothetical protein